MKTFILSAFSFFLLLSVNVFADVDDDSWLKTDFPDKELRLITVEDAGSCLALTKDANIYNHNMDSEEIHTWLKIEFEIEGNVTALSDNYVGTDQGLYLYQYKSVYEKIDVVGDMNILEIFESGGGYGTTFLQSPEGLFTFTASELIECALPDTDQEITAMAFAENRTMSLTTSGELFVSNNNCQTWTKAVENPEGHLFTAIKWDKHNNRFVVGSDKGLFYLTDQLEEVQDFDGGQVNCLIALDIMWLVETENKKDKIQFPVIQTEDIILVGTETNGVYGITGTGEIKQKNDGLDNLNIRAFSYERFGWYVLAGTKEHGIYATQFVFPSVEELNLTPYSLKISPNPAKSRASISFHNLEYADIEIAVYDLFGRKVAEVHSGNLAEGDYNFSADLSGLASGSYFLRFGAGGRVGSLNLIVE
ncbi:MAG: T9SS type A sorting domain-containing protein [Chlorobi bacterium]|nr:T9SS type A sorting domain-containing protein [Chlorobiota bacterium]